MNYVKTVSNEFILRFLKILKSKNDCKIPFQNNRVYLTYLQEYFKPVAHRPDSVEVSDEGDVLAVHLPHS